MTRTTIVIPAYNYERYLAESVRSALTQDDEGVEVVVVDDGSTDGTAAVAQSFGGQVSYVHRPNGGLSAARNTGIAAARGEYVLFLDADDLLPPHSIRTLRGKLEALGPDFGVVGCSHEDIDPEGRWIQDTIQAPEGGMEVTARELLLRTRIGATSLFRREVFARTGGFDESLRASEDRDMLIRLATLGFRVFVLSEKLLKVRRHGLNMSANFERQTACMRRVFAKARQSRVVSPWNVPFWASLWSMYHYQKSSMLWNGKRKAGALRHLCYSLALWPVFARPSHFGKPPFFRLRRLAAWIVKKP
jgi:glycosyltransferase involved in cell wall biosynthesis